MKSSVRSHSLVACGVCQAMVFAREIMTSRGQMSSFSAWCPALLSLRPAACEGWLHGEVDALDVCKRHRRACLGAESASDIVVYGMVRWRLLVKNCGEQRSPVSLGQLRCPYGDAWEEIDEWASGVVVCGMVSDALLSLGKPMVHCLLGPFVAPLDELQMKPRLMMAALIIRS